MFFSTADFVMTTDLAPEAAREKLRSALQQRGEKIPDGKERGYGGTVDQKGFDIYCTAASSTPPRLIGTITPAKNGTGSTVRVSFQPSRAWKAVLMVWVIVMTALVSAMIVTQLPNVFLSLNGLVPNAPDANLPLPVVLAIFLALTVGVIGYRVLFAREIRAAKTFFEKTLKTPS